MKKIIPVLLSLVTMLLLFGCSTAKAPPSETLPAYTDFVSEASFSEFESIRLPYIDEGKLESESIAAINSEIRLIYKELTDNAEDARHAKSNYNSALSGNVLSIVIEYTKGNGSDTPVYAAYNIDVSSAEVISIDQIYSLAGLTSSQVRQSVKAEREAYLVYQNSIYNFADNEGGATLEDFMEEAVYFYDKAYESGELPVYLGSNGLTVYINAYNAASNTKYQITGIKVSNDARKTALDNAPSEILAAVVNEPTDYEKKSASPIDNFILDKTAVDIAEPLIVTALGDDTKITLEYLNYDYNTGEFSLAEVPYEKTLNRGESIYIEAVRPEVRPAEMRLTVQRDSVIGRYYFQFNGRFGNLKIEYVG